MARTIDALAHCCDSTELTGKFSPKEGRGRKLRVSGKTSGAEMEINLIEDVREGCDDATQFTDITIIRSSTNRSSRIIDLSARQYITDEVGDRMALTPRCRTFMLGAEDNDISLFTVMKTVSLAARTVDSAARTDYLMNADPHAPGTSFPKTF